MDNWTVMESMWFSPMGGALIGIVMVETEYDGVQFFIGLGAGHNQANDEKRIMQTGARFPMHVGFELFGKPLEVAKNGQ